MITVVDDLQRTFFSYKIFPVRRELQQIIDHNCNWIKSSVMFIFSTAMISPVRPYHQKTFFQNLVWTVQAYKDTCYWWRRPTTSLVLSPRPFHSFFFGEKLFSSSAKTALVTLIIFSLCTLVHAILWLVDISLG